MTFVAEGAVGAININQLVKRVMEYQSKTKAIETYSKHIQNMQNPSGPPGSSCQASGVFMAKASSRLISARANMAGCLPGSDDWTKCILHHLISSYCTKDSKGDPKEIQRRSKGDQQSLRCAFSIFSAGNMPGTSGPQDPFVEGRMFPCGSAKEPTLAICHGKQGKVKGQ